MTQENVKPTKTAQKYLTIIASGTIQESEIVSMRSFMGKDKGNAQLIFSALDGKELTLYGEQVQKGIDFLTNQWKTPRGVERKNNPFGYREQEALETCETIVLKSFYNAGNAYNDYYLPLYEVVGKDTCFEYYYNGKVNIVG
jgi:hypothetical protein